MRILLADAHPVVRAGLMGILGRALSHTEFIVAASDREIRRRCSEGHIDLVIMAIDIPGRGGLEVLHDLKKERPLVPVIIFSGHPEGQYALRCIHAGAAAYVQKGCSAAVIVSVAQRVLAGGHYVSTRVAETLAFSPATPERRHQRLSDREFEVMKLIATGRSLNDIAGSLHVSPKTVSTYRSRIMAKMGMHVNAEVTRYALEEKLIA